MSANSNGGTVRGRVMPREDGNMDNEVLGIILPCCRQPSFCKGSHSTILPSSALIN